MFVHIFLGLANGLSEHFQVELLVRLFVNKRNVKILVSTRMLLEYCFSTQFSKLEKTKGYKM